MEFNNNDQKMNNGSVNYSEEEAKYNVVDNNQAGDQSNRTGDKEGYGGVEETEPGLDVDQGYHLTEDPEYNQEISNEADQYEQKESIKKVEADEEQHEFQDTGVENDYKQDAYQEYENIAQENRDEQVHVDQTNQENNYKMDNQEYNQDERVEDYKYQNEGQQEAENKWYGSNNNNNENYQDSGNNENYQNNYNQNDNYNQNNDNYNQNNDSYNQNNDGYSQNNDGYSQNNSYKSRNTDDSKIFVGGLGWDLNEDDLSAYFQSFGELIDIVIMREPSTGRSRGFGFVSFSTSEIADSTLTQQHVIKGKKIDVKKAVPKGNQEARVDRTTTKVFVGGIPIEVTEQEIIEAFSKHGNVISVNVMLDKPSGRSRGFAFVQFEDYEAVTNSLNDKGLMLGGKTVDIKPAQPRYNSSSYGKYGGEPNHYSSYPRSRPSHRGGYSKYGSSSYGSYSSHGGHRSYNNHGHGHGHSKYGLASVPRPPQAYNYGYSQQTYTGSYGYGQPAAAASTTHSTHSAYSSYGRQVPSQPQVHEYVHPNPYEQNASVPQASNNYDAYNQTYQQQSYSDYSNDINNVYAQPTPGYSQRPRYSNRPHYHQQTHRQNQHYHPYSR